MSYPFSLDTALARLVAWPTLVSFVLITAMMLLSFYSGYVKNRAPTLAARCANLAGALFVIVLIVSRWP